MTCILVGRIGVAILCFRSGGSRSGEGFFGLHRRGLGSGIRLAVPLDPVEMHDLQTGSEADATILARLVVVEAFIGEKRALHPLVRLEAEWTAADGFGDLLERVGLGDVLRHDGAHML